MSLDYGIKLYTALSPKSVIFQGSSTLSGAMAFLNMATLNNPENRLQFLAVLNNDDVVYIPASDLMPYESEIRKII